jgi:L-alanine-DL-glutamate epimerase-like enolase superfamily enzyme
MTPAIAGAERPAVSIIMGNPRDDAGPDRRLPAEHRVRRVAGRTAATPSAGGARNALDCALWDLEAKQRGRSLFDGIPFPQPTAFTIGMRSLDAYEAAARLHARFPLLKVKVGAGDPLPAIAAVRRGAPQPG